MKRKHRLRARRAGQDIAPGRNQPCPCGNGKKFKLCCSSEHSSPGVVLVNGQPLRGVLDLRIRDLRIK